ncbi:unnamed protein product [Spirodela intermedia]|uniref:Uncharacterized protein n=1 Tax=Spirodela intermedia TaxID=51605 RepID=A0A7I8K2X9_SPIIN|nr:unnamed protein product [Spirodela intermedia]
MPPPPSLSLSLSSLHAWRLINLLLGLSLPTPSPVQENHEFLATKSNKRTL